MNHRHAQMLPTRRGVKSAERKEIEQPCNKAKGFQAQAQGDDRTNLIRGKIKYNGKYKVLNFMLLL